MQKSDWQKSDMRKSHLQRNPSYTRRAALPVFILALMLILGLYWVSSVLAQTGAPPPAGKPTGMPAVARPGTITLTSVGQEALAQYVNQQVKAQGIIGNYIGDKTRYSFAMDNGSAVQVVGSFPDIGGARWTLTARVIREGTKYVLSEVSKEPVGGSSSPLSKIDPLLLAGGFLILAALITFVVMTMRSKSARQKEAYEQQIEDERRRSEATRAEAERLRGASNRAGKADGPGGTVVAGADGAAPRLPAHTIVSIGSVEVVSGPHAGQKFPLQAGETRIGRAKDRGVAILLDKDGEVSSYHGSIVVIMDGRMLYKDESTNGSVVDGKLAHHSQCELHSGSLLEFGGTNLKVTLRMPVSAGLSAPPLPVATPVASQGGVPIALRSAPTISLEAPQPSPKAPAAPTMAGYGAELEAVEGPEAGRRFAITRANTTLGREDRDITLNDESVSRSHATLSAKDGKFILFDNGSAHGTRVAGENVGADGRTLADGDKIVLGNGRTVLLFHQIGG